MILPNSPMNNWKIESITVYSKGFVVGGDGLKVYLYERNFDGD